MDKREIEGRENPLRDGVEEGRRMERRTDGKKDGWNARMTGGIDARMDGYMDDRPDAWTDGQVEYTSEYKNGLMDR